MESWGDRAIEVANLFNPAFCGIVLARAVVGFTERNDQGMPFGLSFLVLPIVLHEETRRSLPRDTRTAFLAWIENHQERHIGFADRVRTMRSFTREALIFDLAHQVLRVGDNGNLLGGEVPISTTAAALGSLTTDSRECINRGRFVGRWLAEAGTTSTIMTSWGISP